MSDEECRDLLVMTCGLVYGWAVRLETEIGTPYAADKDRLVTDMKDWSRRIGTALGVRLVEEGD